MFKSKKRLAVLSIIAWCMLTIPTITFAQNEDCNRFWAKCHVSDINTINTDDESVNSNLLDTIKNAINRCLGILATIVLCFCMYWWFKMLTSGSETKWYDDGRKVLKNALIWLSIILLAWMIVSVIFRFVGTMSEGNQTRIDS